MEREGRTATSASGATFEGRYELFEQFGEGEFGVVYRARQIATGQLVAIKVLRLPDDEDGPARERRVARFDRELRLCARLHHPNIVRLIDSGGDARTGLVYLVFEYVPGQNLRDLLGASGRLDAVEAQHLMAQVLDALACAHGAGVVHRDLKPADIMVVPTGLRRNAMVLDFGVGTLVEGLPPDGARLTGASELLASPAYAAPELLRGAPPTARSDLYSWGLIFVECLTGRPVFSGSTSAEVLAAQLDAAEVPLPAFVEEHALGRLLRRATRKDPAARDVTAAALLGELLACDARPLRDLARGSESAITDEAAFALMTDPSATPSATPAPGGAAELSATASLIAAERRQVTAVCCSLSATPLGAGPADPARLDALLVEQQEACAALARRAGAASAGGLGDQVLFYFGLPSAREDDARRAARLALEIAAAVGAEAQRIEAEQRVRLELRVGVHTGFVVSRDPATALGGQVGGATPKVAAQLSAAARPGTILVTADTVRLLRQHFAFEAAGAQPVGSAERPLEVHLLRGERLGDDTAVLAHSPLVGREQELGLVVQRWSQARGGVGQAILIGGEPGIGKSRLTYELARRLGDEPYMLLECRCTPEARQGTLRPVVELLERLLDFKSGLPHDEKVRRLQELVVRYQLEREALPLLAALLSIPPGGSIPALTLPPPRQKELTLGALLSLLFELCERQPLLFIVEDLHWADSTTLQLLSQLVEEARSARLCALFTARPEFAVPWTGTNVLHLQLTRLERAHIEALIASIAGAALPAGVVSQVASRTDGVPLFVEELTRMVLESEARDEAAIPTTLRDSLMARLDRLGDAKETAQIAAVIGREFLDEVLFAVSPRDEAAVRADLDQLVRAELLLRRRRVRAATCSFKHALIRDTAYESMVTPARREVHARVAAALEARFRDIAETQPELLKHHYAAAGRYAEAASYALKAGQRAMERSADREAEQHFAEGLRWIDQIPPSSERNLVEVRLRSMLAAVLTGTRGYAAPEIEQTLAPTVPLVAGLGDGPELFGIRYTRWAYLLTRSRHDEALRLGEENFAVAQRSGDPTSLLFANIGLGGGNYFCIGRPADALRHLEAAEQLYHPERFRGCTATYGQEPGVTLYLQKAAVLSGCGLPDQALAASLRGLELARPLTHVATRCLALALHEQILQYRDDRAGIRQTFRELQQLCVQHGVPYWDMFGRVVYFWAEVGDDPAAVEGVRQALEMHRMSGAVNLFSYFLSLLADACRATGLVDEGLRHVDEGLAFADEHGERSWVPLLHRVRGELHLARGAEDDAAAAFAEAIAGARRIGTRLHELRAALSWSRLLFRRGERERARDLLSPVCAAFTEGADLPFVQEARSLLAAAST